MKLAGANGTKIYDKTITYDSLNFDNQSVGMAACVFENSPVFIGNLEKSVSKTDAIYVTLEPTTGQQIIKRKIGEDFQPLSFTKEILNKNNNLYVLKQQGKKAIVEMYNSNENLVWSQDFEDTSLLMAGNISVNSNTLFISVLKPNSNSADNNQTYLSESFLIYKLNQSTGTIIDSVIYSTSNDSIQLIELESDENIAYVFYKRSGFVKAIKWNSTVLSQELNLETTYENLSYKGELNLALNFSASSLLYAGKSAIFAIQKNNFTVSQAHTFPTVRSSYDLKLHNGKLFLSGNSNAGLQQITAYNPNDFTIYWNKTYSPGTIYGTKFGLNDSMYAYGINSTSESISILQMKQTNGNMIWEYQRSNSPTSISRSYDLEIYPNKNFIVVAGSEEKTNNSSDAILSMIKKDGLLFWDHINSDNLGLKSASYTLALQQNTVIWAGGQLNNTTFGKAGFIYTLSSEIKDCNNIYGGQAFIDSCNICAGGNTNITPILDPNGCANSIEVLFPKTITLFPNPANNLIHITGLEATNYVASLHDLQGRMITSVKNKDHLEVNLIADGVYIVQISMDGKIYKNRIVVKN
jgi:hypothetical protein